MNEIENIGAEAVRLLPCPFCGEKAIEAGGALSQEPYRIRCTVCLVSLSHSDETVARAQWNSRAVSKFPDIGQDPLKHRDERDVIEAALERTGKGVSLQQKEVPDQTMLAWRIDVSRLRDEVIWRRAAMEAWKKDLVEATGELMVEIPELGTDAAKLLLANVLMRRERDEARQEGTDLREVLTECILSLRGAARYASDDVTRQSVIMPNREEVSIKRMCEITASQAEHALSNSTQKSQSGVVAGAVPSQPKAESGTGIAN